MQLSSQLTAAVLLANEPLAYRQALARVIGAQRPDLVVIAVPSHELDAAVEQHTPFMVICDRLTERVRKSVTAWIELYPSGARRVTSSVRGVQETGGDLDIAQLLAALELAESPITG